MIKNTISDRYEILTRIGIGGFSEVYLAKEKNLGRTVALKRANLLSLSEVDRRRFLREAAILAQIEHRHIIPIYSLEEEGGYLYIVMQYAEKGSLLDLIRTSSGGLPITDVIDLGIAMCKALEAVHAKNVIHRDVKPGNILLFTETATEKPLPKLADFGLARDLTATPLTASEDVFGTLQYTPPETIKGSKGAIDERRDVYGLGAVLYHALTGRPPLGTEPSEILRRLDRAPQSPRRLRRDVPQWLARVILRALAVNPAKRYPNMHSMVGDLEQGKRLSEATGAQQAATRSWLTRYLRNFNSQRIQTIGDQVVSNLLATIMWSIIGIVLVLSIRSCTVLLSGTYTSALPTADPSATLPALSGSITVTVSLSPSPPPSPTPTPTFTPTPTATPTYTSTPTSTSTPTPTRIRTRTHTPTSTLTNTASPTPTATAKPPSPPPAPTLTPTNTLVPPESGTATPTNTLVAP